ncbi:hypothetical protein RSAU_002220 [Staphylococcus aureus subsp. aureus 6850]|nr:hypothetical protein RSAU_002220 [Staphylococcus aureus subsp. aureus 6850]
MSVRGINKVKRELGFVLMALNIRKIASSTSCILSNTILKKADFYQIINRNTAFLHCLRTLCPSLFYACAKRRRTETKGPLVVRGFYACAKRRRTESEGTSRLLGAFMHAQSAGEPKRRDLWLLGAFMHAQSAGEPEID